ncbi:DUF763 domain-containing protein [Treponema ruminis]|uniref:DUF763 domain-containing protein n=1 Tax=Treponema ruminis TaxID=744515 RepID=A0A7W8G8G4_9SPIR|nr:DUF763 domain-containing protein [Treponema ruminis]MBB5225802.1 hypothetical protein [Treponema ruminis]QSI02491.1 DUF763 domain-containing protein [Treponema ruminis]
MLKRSGHADLPLHTGTVPKWLADRMKLLGTEIVEALLINYGKKEVLVRLSDPLWFQSLGAVLGMDWHSSGITTSVMYALKRGINERAREFGLCVCGGRGKYSRKTPDELLYLADATGLDGTSLVNASKLTAKVDGCAVQDGFQLYMHNFVLSDEGDWVVVQQGMNTNLRTARRYHWSSENLRSFVENPHSGVTGENQGKILNLTDSNARETRGTILTLTHENPDRMIKEIAKISGNDFSKQLEFDFEGESLPLASAGKPSSATPSPGVSPQAPSWQGSQILIRNDRNLVMPSHHEVRPEDVDLNRLGSVLATAYESDNKDFESLLLTPGLGPRTLQSLTLVSEVIYGTPSRFSDPARFSFAHGGKDGHPFPVPCRIYDESIRVLGDAIEKSKLGYNDKSECIRRLNATARQIEANCEPMADFEATLEHERAHSKEWGGRTVSD